MGLFYLQCLLGRLSMVLVFVVAIISTAAQETFRDAINSDLAYKLEGPVSLSSKALKLPIARLLVGAEQIEVVNAEISKYYEDPID